MLLWIGSTAIVVPLRPEHCAPTIIALVGLVAGCAWKVETGIAPMISSAVENLRNIAAEKLGRHACQGKHENLLADTG